jgi:hypothetical protein
MSWMDLSDYLVIEEAAAGRIDDLRADGASHASVEIAAQPRPAARRVGICVCERLSPPRAEAA